MRWRLQQYLDQLAQNSERLADAAAAGGDRRTRAVLSGLDRHRPPRPLRARRRLGADDRRAGEGGQHRARAPGDTDPSLQRRRARRRRSATGAQRAGRGARRRSSPDTPGVDLLVDRPHRGVLAAAAVAGDLVHRYDAETRRGHAHPARRRARGRRHRRVPHRVPPAPGRQLRRRRRRHRAPALHRRRGRVAASPAATARSR